MLCFLRWHVDGDGSSGCLGSDQWCDDRCGDRDGSTATVPCKGYLEDIQRHSRSSDIVTILLWIIFGLGGWFIPVVVLGIGWEKKRVGVVRALGYVNLFGQRGEVVE